MRNIDQDFYIKEVSSTFQIDSLHYNNDDITMFRHTL